MEAMGAIAPTAKKVVGQCSKVAPPGIVLCNFFKQQIESIYRRCIQPNCTAKITIAYYASDKKCADLSPKVLGVGILQRSPDHLARVNGYG